MSIDISYMGTKRLLAPEIAKLIAQSREGPVLDGFSGMCSVGQTIAPTRQVWSNDVQEFAALVARLLFTSLDYPPRCSVVPDIAYEDYRKNVSKLSSRFELLLQNEKDALARKDYSRLSKSSEECKTIFERASSQLEITRLRKKPDTFPYRLFTLLYSGTYFGLEQCIEIDSIVYALNCAVDKERLSKGHRAWLLVALAKTMQKVATTTGHFAQFLELKPSTLNLFVKQRARSVWSEWLFSIPDDGPLGSWDWRKRNKVFNRDTLTLIGDLRRAKERPTVIYADPPYTSDHYSRYYHVLETLVRYDYPVSEGKARYRIQRFRTPFSVKREAAKAFQRLAKGAASLGADLIVSYPNDGLLHEIGETPYRLMRPYFRQVEQSRRIKHSHSTMGASKGPAAHDVTEIVYWARP